MAGTRLTFLLDGRDALSRVLDRAGDNADRLGRRLLAASINGDAAMRRLGRTTATNMAGMQRDTNLGEKALKELKGTLISLAPAAIPAAASLAPIAAGAGAAAVAVAAFGAALGPQISAMSEAADAEKAYTDAVAKSGRTSEAAVTAQLEYVRTVSALPPETRRAAAGLSVLKDEYKGWSDGLAKDTMGPVIKGMSVFTALLPKTTGLVKGTSTQLDRMVTIVAGGMASPGLDRLNQKFTTFATGTLQKVNDQLVNLMRTTDTGKVGGGVSEFMDFAKAQGPVVADTLRNVASAVLNLLTAGSDVGVGMLDLVNALSGIVAAVPPGAIAAVLQLALAIKAVKLAAIGMSAASTAMAALGTQLVAMRVAAAAAPGRLSAVTAAIGAMSRTAKLAVAGTGIGLLLIALTQLSQRGKQTPPDVDKLTSSLGRLGQTGKITGEAARVMGTDLSALSKSLGTLSNPSITQGIEKWVSDLLGYGDGGPDIKAASKNIDAIDDALAGLVQGGKAELAAAALARIAKGLPPAKAAELKAGLDGYKEALANAAFESQLAAQAQGLFGTQAQQVQTKLDAQKRSTDGLRQSIIALNEVNRAALEGRAGMEAAIDAVAKATKGHANALRISNGELDLNSQKARDAQAALSDLARKTEGNVTSARDSGKSWEYAKGQYDRGRTALIDAADAMGLNRTEAKKLADQILKTPNKTAYLKGNLEDLQAKLATAKDRLNKVPDSRKARVRADIAQLQSQIRQAKGLLAGIPDEQVGVGIYLKATSSDKDANGVPDMVQARASGGLVGFPGGGHVRGPGTGTSDSILTRLSNGEFVVRAASVSKYGLGMMRAINEGRLGTAATASAPRPVAGRAAVASGGAVTIVNVHVDARGAMDPVAVGREVEKIRLKYDRTQGKR